MTSGIRSRIAPTPSGFLHIGNAFNFLLTEHIVRRAGGSLLLRIDDLDAPRIRPAYISDIFETLRWLGITPDSGPTDEAGFSAAYSQQGRLPQYRRLLDDLAATGKVFACTCSRAEVHRHSSDGQYPGTCRDKGIPLSAPDAAWRFRTEPDSTAAWRDSICGPQTLSLFAHSRDFIIRRRDGLPAYHVASLFDDVAYEINVVVRGQDLIGSTAAQLHLAAALGLAPFLRCRFYHHPLLTNEHGEKLSKSAGSDSLKALREADVPGSEVRRMAEQWYGQLAN